MIKKNFACVGSVAALSLLSGASIAAVVNVGFDPVGAPVAPDTVVTVSGSAGASGTTGGSAWDVALVLDSSGSMAGEAQRLQQDAANALVGSLPSSTSVSVVEYDRNANVVVGLTPISTGLSSVTNAVNATDARGGTDIRNGIEAASNELTVSNNGFPGNPDPSRSQVMVVLSDGGSVSRTELTHNAAQAAVTAGVSQVHSVGISSTHNVASMQNIVSGADGIFNNGDDIGVYTDGSDLSSLVALFSGGGTLVGLDRIEITLPDGSILRSADGDFSIGALGNFTFDYQLVEGANPFTALAFGSDGSSATASIVYNTIAAAPGTPTVPDTPAIPGTPTAPSTPTAPGTATTPSAVPIPAAVWLFGSAIFGLVGFGRRKQ